MVSIIIVHYHVKKELFVCLKSIIDSKPKTSFEIIVVDNDEVKTLQNDIKKVFPKVTYIANKNKGFGQGNNVGAKKARGEYLFFLNPDTKVYRKTIDEMSSYIDNNQKVGIVAPLLYDDTNNLYPQGAKELTPIAAIFSFSFIHRIFPNNPIAKKYWMKKEWDKKNVKEVDSIPGTAFVIRKKLYHRIKGFDEHFFMYFEEHDLCKRVKSLGWKIVMLPQSKVYHALGRSSSQVSSINKIFEQSRYYYFKKHYGLQSALLTESIMRFNKYSLILLITVLLSGGFAVYKLEDYTIFMGDQAWYYLSARDLISTGLIPLVGIASSHTWLHQGAFWTYMLAPLLALSKFSPISGAYLSILLSLVSVICLYRLGSEMFSKRLGLLAAILYATSPFIIFQSRIPYHTSPIPLLTIIYFYALYKWVEGNKNFLPIIVACLAILYNFQIATFVLTITFISVVVFGILKRKQWLIKSLTKKNVSISLVAFIVPMLPMLIYDIQHGFPQTVQFIVWVGYKVAQVFGYPSIHPEIADTNFKTVIAFLGVSYQKIVYLPSAVIAFTLGVFSFGLLLNEVIHSIKSKRHNVGSYLLMLITLICVAGIIATKTISEAYLPVLFPVVALITAFFFDKLIKLRPQLTIVIFLIVGIIIVTNTYALVQRQYLVGEGTGLSSRIADAKQIVTQADERSYNLVGKGEGSQFETFTMNYKYLTWWLGNEPSETPQKLQFTISEDARGVIINKND